MNSRQLKSQLQIVGIAALASVAAVLGVLSFNASHASAASGDCSTNAIMHCGTSGTADFINKVKSSNGNTQGDLAAIYSHYGLAPADYARFVSSAKPGKAYKNGTIKTLDGRTVATGAKSIGRNAGNQGPGYFSQSIGGTTYYGNANNVVMLSDSMDVTILFNAQGQMEFAVINNCGNPTFGTLNNPNYSCNTLNKKQVDRDTYQFSTKASAGNGASINKVVYDFGDGTSTTKTNPSETVTHTYAKPGNYTAKVTVYVNVPGSQVYAIAPAGDCAKPVQVLPPTPVYACDILNMTPVKGTDDTFTFTSKITQANGAKFTKVIYNYGDGSKPVDSTNVASAVSHRYLTAGSFTPFVTAYFTLPDGKAVSATAANCKKTLTLQPVYACTLLQASAIDSKKTSFRFTAKHTERRATLKDATFVLDNSTSSVVKPDAAGAVSKDYTFTDNNKHTVAVTLAYSIGNTTKTVKCSASVTATQPPKCPVPGKENLPPDSPNCYTPCPLNPNVPVGSVECTPVVTTTNKPLPSTGPGDVAAMFAVLAGFGAGTHYYLKKRSDRVNRLATATVNDDSQAALESFIARTHANDDEAALAVHEFHHLHPEASSRTSHHRLIQKAVPGSIVKPHDHEQ